MSALVAVIRRAVRLGRGPVGLRRIGWSAAAAFAATIIAGGALLLSRTIAQWSQQGGGAAHLVVYLRTGTDGPTSQSLVDELAAMGGVAHVESVAPAEAFGRLRTALGKDQALLEGIEPDAMPVTIEVSLEAGVDQVIPLSPTISSLRRHPVVEDVVLERARPDNLAASMSALTPWVEALWRAAAGLAVLLSFAVIRLAWDLPRREIAIARLLGAGPGFHLLPVAVAAASAAVVGSALGVAGLLWSGLRVTTSLVSPSMNLRLDAVLGPMDASLMVLTATLVAAVAGARACTQGEDHAE
jgi:cell division protein FtsX